MKMNNKTEFVFDEHLKNFTTIPNEIILDNTISSKALGVYVQLLMYRNAPNHKIYQSALEKNKKDGRNSFASAFKELIKAGYLKKEQLRDKFNKFCGVKYTVYQTPNKKVLIKTSSESTKKEIVKSEPLKDATNNKIYNNNINNNKISSKSAEVVFDEVIAETNNGMKKDDLIDMKNRIISNVAKKGNGINNMFSYIKTSINNYKHPKVGNYSAPPKKNAFCDYANNGVDLDKLGEIRLQAYRKYEDDPIVDEIITVKDKIIERLENTFPNAKFYLAKSNILGYFNLEYNYKEKIKEKTINIKMGVILEKLGISKRLSHNFFISQL